MSFAGEVKEELAKRISPARHCQIAELAALMNFCGQFGQDENGGFLVGFQTENEAVARKCFTLLQKTYNINTDIVMKAQEIEGLLDKLGNPDRPVSSLLLKKTCCRRAFLRGAFLSIGFMSDPAKGYHLEFDCSDADKAKQLQELIRGFGIESRIVVRKRYHIVYLKEGAAIVELLNICEAPQSLMNMENLRILKEVRNTVNRRVNCETANIAKTIGAAARQLEDIEYIRTHYGFENLPDNLREMAEIRLEHPDVPLKELGEFFDPVLGKSGVNHRLRRLSELAEKIRL